MVESIISVNNIINISGGVREALFGDEYYPIMWGNRCGFAKVAIQANVVGVFSIGGLILYVIF